MPPVTTLSGFSGDDLTRFGDTIRAIPHDARTMEDAARRVADFFWGELSGDLALVRVYKTHPYGLLPADLQEFAAHLSGGAPAPDVRCLTLLGTRGLEPAWNDRRDSEGHKAIPLPSAEFVERLPMVAGLVRQLGLEIEDVVRPQKGRVVALAQRTYDVFHVPDAAGSEYLPAQDFVEAHGIRSALGFGGVLYTGDFFAVVIFSRVPIAKSTADTLRILSLATRVALMPFSSRVFDN
jgi:hypothetical protein